MFARAGAVIAHMSDTAVKTEPSPERALSAQGLGAAQPVGASDESPVVAQADAEVASPVQPATTAENLAQAVGAACQASTVVRPVQPVSAPDEALWMHKQTLQRQVLCSLHRPQRAMHRQMVWQVKL